MTRKSFRFPSRYLEEITTVSIDVLQVRVNAIGARSTPSPPDNQLDWYGGVEPPITKGHLAFGRIEYSFLEIQSHNYSLCRVVNGGLLFIEGMDQMLLQGLECPAVFCSLDGSQHNDNELLRINRPVLH